MIVSFDQFFQNARGREAIAFDYQRRVAEHPECKSLIGVPID